MSVTTSYDPDLLIGRVFNSIIGAMDLFTIYVGDQLGFYHILKELGQRPQNNWRQGAVPMSVRRGNGWSSRR